MANVSYKFLFDITNITTPRKGVAKKQPKKNSIAASLAMRGSSLYGRSARGFPGGPGLQNQRK
jgi:hypothetical protein